MMSAMATGHDAASDHADHDHGHGHDDHDDHGHGHDDHRHGDGSGWVLIPLAAGLVVGLVLAIVFGIGADALAII